MLHLGLEQRTEIYPSFSPGATSESVGIDLFDKDYDVDDVPPIIWGRHQFIDSGQSWWEVDAMECGGIPN